MIQFRPRSAHLPLALALLAACGAESTSPAAAPAAGPASTGAAAPTPPRAALPGARLVFEDAILDFGKVSDTEDIVGSFPFVNGGDKALLIGEIKPSCGCTTVELEQLRYEPGEGSAIDVVWKPKGFGNQAKTITVQSNSQDEPILQLVVRAEIEPFARFLPSPLRPGVLPIGREHRFKVAMTCADPDFEILELTPTHPAVSVSAGQRTEDGVQPLEVVIGPGAPWGAFNTSVRVKLRGRPAADRDPIEHYVDLGVNASLFGELRVQPTLFAVGQVLPGRTFERKIELRHGDARPFEVTKIEVLNPQPPDMTARVERVDAGTEQGWTIVLSGETKDYLGLVRASVRFETDIPGEEPRTVPVMGIVRE